MAKLEMAKTELAEALDVTTRSIETFQTEPDFPQPRREGRSNRYPAAACIAWFLEYRIGQRIGESDDGETLDLQQEKARLAKVQRERQALLLARERGELVAVEAVADGVGSEYDRVRARVLALPAKLAPIIAIESDIDVCRYLIEREVHAALLELSSPDDIAGAVNG